ncbi:uncharacterized protein LOC126881746 [Diabrotica virgifera virgifera]|uniref:Uncharacterized protein n=1 Tax=Diabrotica virgifera virgifera TaxID=50390 RepID=A0ABM5JW59_DIAVI|nr:uncharacterized protein LOC126881746 [Diabrotica virgifera virgifera]
MTNAERVFSSFSCLHSKLVKDDGVILVQDISSEIRAMMDAKANAVLNIADYAEFLSYHRTHVPLFENSTYYYYNADNLTNVDYSTAAEERLKEETLNLTNNITNAYNTVIIFSSIDEVQQAMKNVNVCENWGLSLNFRRQNGC